MNALPVLFGEAYRTEVVRLADVEKAHAIDNTLNGPEKALPTF